MKKIICIILMLCTALFLPQTAFSIDEQSSLTTTLKPSITYEKFEIAVVVSDNPGIWSYNFKIGYNPEALEYVSSEMNYQIWKRSEICNIVPQNNPLIIYAESDSCVYDNEKSGTVAFLTFNIKDHSKPFDISYSFDQNGIFSVKDTKNTVKMNVVNNCPEHFIPGDVDGDGEISMADSLLLVKKLAGKTINFEGLCFDADMNGDVNAKDHLYISKILAFGN